MHYLYFVVVEATSSKDARKRATDQLIEHGFLNDGAYFSVGKATCFIIGGRWSGILQQRTEEFEERVREEQVLREENHKNALQKTWESVGGEGLNPYCRDSEKGEGYADDARILTPELLQELGKNHPETEIFVPDCDHEGKISETDPDDVVGRSIVVVDYCGYLI